MYFPYSFWSNSNLRQNLIAFWNLNDQDPPTNDIIVDSFGNFNATIFSTDNTYRERFNSVAGKINNGFNNTNTDSVFPNYIYVTDSLGKFNMTTSKTFALWTKTDQSIAGSSLANYLFAKYFEGTAQYLATINDGAVLFTIATDTPSEYSVQSDALITSTSIWYFIVIKHDIINKKISVQVNNGIIYEASYLGTPINVTQQFRLLEDGSYGANIDAFGVWDRLLTPSEITYLYNSGNGKEYPL